MRKLVRAVAYASGRRQSSFPGRSSPDEDEFTRTATVIERAISGLPPTPTVTVDLLGEFPTAMEWALAPLVGSPVRIQRSTGSARGLRDALVAAAAEGEGLALVVAVGPRSWPGTPRGPDAAVALALAGSGGGDLAAQAESVAEEGSALDAAFALYRGRREGASETLWEGDWKEPPEKTGGDPVSPRDPEPSADRVSQGAYVPRARYLENLPSRWRFVADRCPVDGLLTFPARGRCRSCGRSEGLQPVGLPRDGALVVATTVIGSGGQPTEFDPQVEAYGPYEVVLAELAPGARVTLQVTDGVPGEVRIGDRVDTVLRRLYATEGEWRYGRKAVPIDRPSPVPV